MRRYPAFDPPEYVHWAPDPEAMARFRARVPALLPPDTTLLALYEGMLRNRLHDIALKRWVRQGVISKAWLGTGEEAVTIGNVHALEKGDVVGPMIRNAGACHEMGMPLVEMFKAYLGSSDGMTRGRDLHTGDPAKGVIPPTSFVASLAPVFAGIALSFRIRNEPRVAMTWVGDGARWTAEFHEGMNFAAVNRVPLVMVLQDNQVALGTHKSAHSRAECSEMAAAYGVEGISCDGNNVLDVHAASVTAVARCRGGDGPVMLTATTFRMGGHATHDEAEAR
ncbi:MAG TPA: thiamine pyrophosphate-dependent enzyme, partial [Candidatus Polarisedimenticolia bacterium]|nr:thiamine pyrophosphate-dependent enzyme [Candidatus Polarisedimenticolia bacterium]